MAEGKEDVKLQDAAAALTAASDTASEPAQADNDNNNNNNKPAAASAAEEEEKSETAESSAAEASVAAGDVSSSVAEATHEQQALQQFDFGERRRRKKKDKKEAEEEEEGQAMVDGSGEVFHRGKEYTYQEMLQRIQTLIEMHNPDLSGAKRYTIKPPQVVRVGSKKVAWINFRDICTIMNRQADHVHQFVLAELGTEGSIAGDGQLVLKGKYGPKHIEALLRKYISTYTLAG